MSVLLQVSSLTGLSGGEDKHQDASTLEPPARLVRLGVSNHFLFGHIGVFKFIASLRVVARHCGGGGQGEGNSGTGRDWLPLVDPQCRSVRCY